MSRVDSNYARKERDLYVSPSWVTEAVIPFLPTRTKVIWEPACGDGTMVRVFADSGYDVYATDVIDGEDFLQMKREEPDAAICKHSQQDRSACTLGDTQDRNRGALPIGEGFAENNGKALRRVTDGIRARAAKAEHASKANMALWTRTWALHRRQSEQALSQDDKKELLQSLWNEQSTIDPSQRRQSHKQYIGESGSSLLALSHNSPQARVLGTQAGDWGIATNPPFGLATSFIEHALQLTASHGCVAMLLAADFDSAKTRRHLFGDCPIFSKTIVLTKRIVWFERDDGKKAAPSENHRWFLWDWKHKGPPTIGYAP